MDEHVRGSGLPRTNEPALLPPLGSVGAVSRPRLVAALDAALERPESFVMVSAPAGYGKTYLLTEWADLNRDRGLVTAWYRATMDDRDPLVLWRGIIGALRRAACEREAAELGSALEPLVPSMVACEHAEFVAAFREALADSGEQIILIVDDAHQLEGTDAEAEFIRLIRSLPANVFLAFATRSPLQTQADRVSGRLRELTVDSLSFTRAETTELFKLHGFEDSDIEQIYSGAEGWPAALSLALLDVERDPSGATLIDDWSDPTILYDYMNHELFEDLDPASRNVLFSLGITKSTTSDLVNAIMQTSDSGQLLKTLASRNQILRRISTHADGRTWYGVTPLLGRFLKEQTRDTDPDEFRAMTERAVDWFIEFGDGFAALDVALEPANGKLVDRVLRRRGYDMISDGHAEQLLAMLPSSNRSALSGAFSRAMTAYAAACVPKPERAAELLRAVDLSALSADDLLEWDWLVYLVGAQVTLATGKPLGAVEAHWPESSLSSMPEPLRLAIGITRGMIEAKAGNTEAVGELTAALAVAENEDDLSSMVLGTVGMAAAAAAVCDFHAVRRHCGRAMELTAHSTTQNQHGSRAIAHNLLMWAAMEQLDAPLAKNHATLAVESAGRQPDEWVKLQAQDGYNDAFFDSLPSRRRVTQLFTTNWPPPYLEGAADVYLVASLYAALRMTADIGERRWSEHVLDRARLVLGESPDWQVAYALHLLQSGKGEGARTILSGVLDVPGVSMSPLSEIVALSVQAVLEVRAHNQYRAHASVYRALELADATGAYRRVHLADRATILQVIVDGAGRFGPHEHVARRLLSDDGAAVVSQFGALTERERGILLELTTLRTVEEIAHDLLLSVNTVKTHMRGIYRKLDVTSRRQAVAEAERLGLL